jgi:dipeptidyl aminopeptidase/acylaminoacyl peptidase
MPWDGSELRSALVTRDDAGDPVGLGPSVLVAGGAHESVVQPGFTRHGDLVFCTDRTGWWNPWRVEADRIGVLGPEPVLAGGGAEVEIGGPLWVGGLRWWAELADGRLLVTARHHGADHLAVIGSDGVLAELDAPFTEVDQVVANDAGDVVAVVAASPVAEPAPHLVSLSDRAEDEVDDYGDRTTLELERLRPHRDVGLGFDWISVPRHVTFGSTDGRVAHALVYPPTNPTVRAPAGERPPLVVMVHGGPTSAATHRLDLGKQYWTTRGFAVVDVDHGGSTGYGRPFRRLLDGEWGVVDVEDAVAAARFLAGTPSGDGTTDDDGADEVGVTADPDRLAIRGGSAGGFTTLAALCFHDTFSAGTSRYGVADLAVLAQDTHKFESRYLDGLVGPWPSASGAYEARSPLHHTEGFRVPLLVLQGADDRVVPPNQAEMIVAALVERGVPHAYVLFEGEGHGFRRADSIVRALEAELWFYGRVFGFTPADPIAPLDGAVGL